jgi:hypothetical protein
MRGQNHDQGPAYALEAYLQEAALEVYNSNSRYERHFAILSMRVMTSSGCL